MTAPKTKVLLLLLIILGLLASLYFLLKASKYNPGKRVLDPLASKIQEIEPILQATYPNLKFSSQRLDPTSQRYSTENRTFSQESSLLYYLSSFPKTNLKDSQNRWAREAKFTSTNPTQYAWGFVNTQDQSTIQAQLKIDGFAPNPLNSGQTYACPCQTEFSLTLHTSSPN